jgi:hypothetical protein
MLFILTGRRSSEEQAHPRPVGREQHSRQVDEGGHLNRSSSGKGSLAPLCSLR